MSHEIAEFVRQVPEPYFWWTLGLAYILIGIRTGNRIGLYITGNSCYTYSDPEAVIPAVSAGIFWPIYFVGYILYYPGYYLCKVATWKQK